MSITSYLQKNKITSISFSKTGQLCAIATKQKIRIKIFHIKQLNNINSWIELAELSEHSQTISDMDWSQDKKLVTCSHDRSVTVWKQSNQKWKKQLVNIDIKLSILTIKWASTCKKFTLGSSCCTLAFCSFSEEVKGWTAHSREKFTKSPITSVCFHPSSNLVAVGSADCSVKVVTCNFLKIKGYQHIDENNKYTGPFQSIDTIFEIILNLDNVGSWINFVSFQNHGNNLLIIPHGFPIRILHLQQHNNNNINYKQQFINWKNLPFQNGFINCQGLLFLGGFDRKVALFKPTNNGYQFLKFLTNNEKTSTGAVKKGIVAKFTSGIQKKQSLFGESPKISQHLNAIKIIENKRICISYDINGIVHFWQN